MHIVINKAKHGKKIYNSILLRESYRENGKVKKRTIANLSNCPSEEIEAIKLALKYKTELWSLINVKEDINLKEGLSVGAVWTAYQLAKRLGIERALGTDNNGKLALWQVIARTIDQGSRLSAVRLAKSHAACDVLGIEQGFNEDDLYVNLAWLSDQQELIEDRLFSLRKGSGTCELFLYDVTSCYLEGVENHFGAYGYNRDGKRGKQQIVIGLLCDAHGEPVSVEVFAGNTQDVKTFASQVKKVVARFGCERVTFVGDRGMIKTTQIKGLEEGMHFITAITKVQVDSLIKQGHIQLAMFEKELCEIETPDGVRYILRKNPARAEELSDNRLSKRQDIEQALSNKNNYLSSHRRADVSVAEREISRKIKQLKVDKWLTVHVDGRRLNLSTDEDALKEVSRLDGCYVIKTDLPQLAANKEIVHGRYKDLALVEQAFRTCKTTLLEVRPVFVRKEKSTRGHVFVVMLAYKIIRHLREAWQQFNVTVEEGLRQLNTLTSIEVSIGEKASCLKIPSPREQSQRLLNALNISLPVVLPHKAVNVDTRKKLHVQRKAN
jgi:transposase